MPPTKRYSSDCLEVDAFRFDHDSDVVLRNARAETVVTRARHGDWFVDDGEKQYIMADPDFTRTFTPFGVDK